MLFTSAGNRQGQALFKELPTKDKNQHLHQSLSLHAATIQDMAPSPSIFYEKLQRTRTLGNTGVRRRNNDILQHHPP